MKKIVALLFAVGLLLVAVAGAQDEPLFHVVPNNNLNLRACASTDCDKVGQVRAGTKLLVYAVEGDWYQVLVDGELVWMAGWLTTRVTATPKATLTPSPTQIPDKVLLTDENYFDRKTRCALLVNEVPGKRNLTVFLGGVQEK